METQKRYNKNIKWKVSLSNGETFYENKGPYKTYTGQRPAWALLQEYINKNNLEITSLSLYRDNGQTFNLPSSGKRPKFRAFDGIEKPVGFSFLRKYKAEYDLMSGRQIVESSEEYAVAQAKYKDHSLQLWVSEKNPDNCWALVNYTHL